MSLVFRIIHSEVCRKIIKVLANQDTFISLSEIKRLGNLKYYPSTEITLLKAGNLIEVIVKDRRQYCKLTDKGKKLAKIIEELDKIDSSGEMYED